MAKKKFNKREKDLLVYGGGATALGSLSAASAHQQQKSNLNKAADFERASKRYAEEAYSNPGRGLNTHTMQGLNAHIAGMNARTTERQANTFRKIAKVNRITKYAAGASAAAGAAEVGAAFYLRHRRGKVEKVRKPGRSRTGK